MHALRTTEEIDNATRTLSILIINMIKFEEEEERVINLIQRQKESFINILNLKDETEVQERFDDLEDQITIHGIKVD
jgi:predicted GTPase